MTPLDFETWCAVQAERRDHDHMYGVEYQTADDTHQEWLDQQDKLDDKAPPHARRVRASSTAPVPSFLLPAGRAHPTSETA